MTDLLVNQIRPGLTVHGVFALKAKKLLPYREAPGHFLAVTLADRTGSVEGRLWEGAEEAGDRLKVGDIVAVEALAVGREAIIGSPEVDGSGQRRENPGRTVRRGRG